MKFGRSRCSHLVVQYFDRTDKIFDLDFSVQIFVRLACFCANRTPNRTNFRPVDQDHVKVASVLKKGSTIRDGDHAALGIPHEIGWENNEQTKLTMERSPKTKELRNIAI